MRAKPAVGARIQLTGEFLRATGQFAGFESHSKWTVVACDCGLCQKGPYIAVDQPSADDPTRNRHMNYANVEPCR